MLDEKKDENFRFTAFETLMRGALCDIKENVDVKKVDMVWKHYLIYLCELHKNEI